tara:strand:+ start:1954 stop:2361 length:408 start_codon:yes stop_codon:yes gene_type:complete
MNNFRKKDLIDIINVYQDHIDQYELLTDTDIDDMYLKIAKKDEEIQKIKKAFNYQKTPYNLKYDLITYIKENLYDDNISVQRFGKMYVFKWAFAPQTAGTLTQQMSYQTMKIEQMANKIINYFSEVDKEKTKIID